VLVTVEFPGIRELQILGKKIACLYGGGRFQKKERRFSLGIIHLLGFLSKCSEDKVLSRSFRKIELIFQPSRKKFASNACLWIVPVARCSNRLKCVIKNDKKKA